MTPITIDETEKELLKFYDRISDSKFDYHQLTKLSQEKYHHIIALCETITEKHKIQPNNTLLS